MEGVARSAVDLAFKMGCSYAQARIQKDFGGTAIMKDGNLEGTKPDPISLDICFDYAFASTSLMQVPGGSITNAGSMAGPIYPRNVIEPGIEGIGIL
jgi:hypothetical protein